MGCDIHAHVEVRLDGDWRHYSMPAVGRHYLLFAYMADVRNYGAEPMAVAAPRGLPADASVVTRYEADQWGVDGHSHSWLTFDEMQEVDRLMQVACADHPGWAFHLGREFGWIMADCAGYELTPLGVRVVFWFDN